MPMVNSQRGVIKYNEKITIQKAKTVTDDDTFDDDTQWEDYYQARCQIQTSMGSEAIAVRPFLDCKAEGFERVVTVYLRCCRLAKAIIPVQYRFILDGKIYHILSVDNVNEENKEIRFKGGLKL